MNRDVVGLCQGALTTVRSVGDVLTGWLDLLVRFWLAQAFLTDAAASLMSHAPPAMAGAGDVIAHLNGLIASPFGVLVQTICPVLLLGGLGSRVAAVPLLIRATLLAGPGSDSSIHVFWSLLLGWVIVMGPGPFSLDAVLGQGLDTSAIPGAARLRAALAWLTRSAGAPYRLLLRLWIAAAPVAGALATLDGVWIKDLGAGAPWLAAIPARTAMLPPAPSLLLGALLALGLGTRGCALVLLLAIPVGQIGMALDDRLYWTLLLGLVICWGAGPLSIDHGLATMVTRLARRMRGVAADLPHVVIVGGGFGGIAAARGLKRAPCRVTLIDRRNYTLFQPLLYQVATAGLSPADIATPIRSLCRSQDNLRVLLADVQGVSPDTAEVILAGERLRYDILVLATGAQHSYFGRDDWAPDAPGLKSIEDATAIRRRLLIAFERAEASRDPAARAAFLTFVIVGGGPTGVELAGAIAELARHGLAREFGDIDPGTAKVILVQSGPRILPTFPASLSADAAGELARLGVDVRTGSRVGAVDRRGVTVDGTRIDAGTVLWAAGVTASPAGHWLGVPTDGAGRIVVAPDLSVAPHASVFAIGDTAASSAWNGRAVPGLAPAAKQGGGYVAGVIRARLAGRPAPKPFRYRHAGSLATIGRQAAVAELGHLRLRGALAWWVWGAVHILFLAGGRNRASVVVEWAWAYLTYRRGSRLITDANVPMP